MKLYEYKSGAYVTLEKSAPPYGMYTVTIRDPRGEVHDKIRCDDYSDTMEYFRAFKKIATNKK